MYNLGDTTTKSAQIDFFTPFCDQKWYCAFCSFSLGKMLISPKYQMELLRIQRLGIQNLVKLKF